MLGSDDPVAFLSGINIRATLARVFSLHQSGLGGAFQHNPMQFIIDGTLWSIRYEFDCYLLVAAFGLVGLLSRIPVGLLFLAFSFTYFAQRAGYIVMPNWDYGPLAILFSNPINWPRLFTYFFAGSAFYLWREAIPKSWIICSLALLTVVTGLRFGSAEPVLIISGTYFIFAVALSTAAVPRIRGRRIDLSYGIYLFGFPIQQLIIAWSSQSVTPVWLFLTSFLATCCVAYLSWMFIEAPCLRWVWPTWLEIRSRVFSLVAWSASPPTAPVRLSADNRQQG
jgi:peptidoglycan/LPS O-acetylase OafA/YrhL